MRSSDNDDPFIRCCVTLRLETTCGCLADPTCGIGVCLLDKNLQRLHRTLLGMGERLRNVLSIQQCVQATNFQGHLTPWPSISKVKHVIHVMKCSCDHHPVFSWHWQRTEFLSLFVSGLSSRVVVGYSGAISARLRACQLWRVRQTISEWLFVNECRVPFTLLHSRSHYRGTLHPEGKILVIGGGIANQLPTPLGSSSAMAVSTVLSARV